jgi:flagellar biosynthesis GTPase FlhF
MAISIIKVIKKAMKFTKATEQNEKKKDKKEKESSGGEDTDHTQDDSVRDDHLQTIKVEEEHKRRKEERRRKREAAKRSMPEVDVQNERRADDRPCKHKDVRRERAFIWYARLGAPTRAQFKRKVTAAESINVTPRDIDLLPWNSTGRVVNVAKMNAMVRASILEQ